MQKSRVSKRERDAELDVPPLFMCDFRKYENTISILVASEPGELSRIVGLFSARGYNIETMSVGKTLGTQLVTSDHRYRR